MVKMKMKRVLNILMSVMALATFAGEAAAATCTSLKSGNWNSNTTWSCNKTPGAGDIVIIQSPHSVDLNGNNRSAASLTINAGATLVDSGQDLTVSGNVVVNGTYDGSGNNGSLIMTGNGSTLSGTGTVIDIKRIQIDANVTIPAGSNLNLTLQSEIRVGNNNPATLTIDGTITGTSQTNGNRLIRVDNNNASTVIINGTIDAPNAYIQIQQDGTIQNNGTVSIAYLDGNGDTNVTWTQGVNSTLSLSQPTQGWNNGTFTASAMGNTVNFNGTATPFDPATYYNIAGVGVPCPLPATITVLGSSPCAGGGGGGATCTGLLPPPPPGGTPVASGGTISFGSGANVNGTAVTLTAGSNTILNPATTTTWNSGSAPLPLPPSPIPTSTVQTVVGAGGLAAGSYGDVRVNTGTGIFTGGDYFINELYVAPGATAQLAPGNYYVNKLTIGSSITKTGGNLTISPSGLVKIYVKTNAKGDAALYGGSSGIWDGSTVNVGGNPGNLQILLYDTVTYFEIGDNSQLTGFVVQPVYSGAAGNKAIDVHNNVTITGGVYTAGLLNIKNNVTFNYTPQVAAAIQSMSQCGPHHFEIQHPGGTGVTCTPSTLTIVACANAACTSQYTSGASGTLSATGVPTTNWAGGATFSIAAGSGSVTKDVQVTQVGSVTLDAIGSPTAAVATTCNFGAPSCTFTAADSALLLTTSNHIAETNVPLTVRAVKAALGNPLLCTPRITGNKSVNLKCAYTNPASGSLPVRVAGMALNAGNSPGATCDASGATVTLNFDATGTAATTLQYADVGQMSLSATHTGTGISAGLVMTGSTSFISAPASISITGVNAGPVQASSPFSATVSVLNAAGNPVPNFGKEAAPEGVSLSSVLAMGAGTWNNPALNNSVIPGASFSNGQATLNNLSWDEVGAINLHGQLTSGNYLTSGLANAVGNTATATTFVPHHYGTEIVSGELLACPPTLTCPANISGASGMAYAGRPFGVKVYALNGTCTATLTCVTQNYQGAYAQDVNLSGVAATGGPLANPVLAAANFSAGVATTATQPNYPLGAGKVAPTTVAIRATGTGSAATSSSGGFVESGLIVAQGRVKVSNAYGSDKVPLVVPVVIQYYDGTQWVLSTTDGSTVLGGLSAPGATVNNAGSLAGGVLNGFKLSGSGTLQVGFGSPTYLTSVPGQVTFGIYKGSNELIYRREAY